MSSRSDDPPKPSGSGDPLKSALDDLENMLDRHRDPDSDEDAEAPDEADAAGPAPDDDRYSIPLLNDVVLPPASPSPQGGARQPVDRDYEEAVALMAERLGSEIDVIVQSAVEEAVELLRRDVAERLREHLDITLPEILEELVHRRRDG